MTGAARGTRRPGDRFWPTAAALTLLATIGIACGVNRKPATAPRPAPPSATPAANPAPRAADDAWITAFQSAIRPMLAQRCTPCHQPGGIMYGRLPFDDARTVADAARDRPGFLRRLKGADHEAVEAWIATLPAR